MNDGHDPRFGWLSRWSHDRISLVDAYSAVHTRFGFAAQAASELETALVMLVSQVQQVRESRLTHDDFLEYATTRAGRQPASRATDLAPRRQARRASREFPNRALHARF
jgi:hypothetical protein